MDLDVLKGVPVLAWLFWCTGIAGGFLIGMAFRSLLDRVGEGRFDRTLYPAEPAWPKTCQAAGGPPEGPPMITCSTRIELPRAYWDILDGRVKITLRSIPPRPDPPPNVVLRTRHKVPPTAMVRREDLFPTMPVPPPNIEEKIGVRAPRSK